MEPEIALEPALQAQEPAPAPLRLGPLVASLIFLAYLVAQVIAGAIGGIVGAVFFTVRRGHPYPELMTDVQRYLLMPTAVFGVLVAGLVTAGITALVLRGSGPAGRQSIGWVGASARSLLLASVAGVALGGLYLLAATYLPEPAGRSFGPMAAAVAMGGSARLFWALLAVLVAPPVEEFVFRGVLFGGLARSWSTVSAGAVVTLVFVVAHLSEVWGHPTAIVTVTTLGAVLMLTRIRTGSLLPVVALHAVYNLVLVIATYMGAG